MSKPDWVPRIYIELSPEEFQRYQKLMPHGTKGKLIAPLVSSFLDLVEQNPELAFGALLGGRLTAKTMIERHKDGKP